MDEYSDHCLFCVKHCKTPMHDRIRDDLMRIFKTLLPLVKLTIDHAFIEKEPPCQIKPIPDIRPFDITARFDHLLDETA